MSFKRDNRKDIPLDVFIKEHYGLVTAEFNRFADQLPCYYQAEKTRAMIDEIF